MATLSLYRSIYSKVTVTIAIITIPKIKAENCFRDSFGSSSLSRSGRTVTKAMCRNVPAVNGKIHDVRASEIIKQKEVNKDIETEWEIYVTVNSAQ